MKNINIYTWGKTKDKNIDDLIIKYEKYLKPANIKWHIFSEKITSVDDKKGSDQMEQDLNKILNSSDTQNTIVISEHGKNIDSVEFADFINNVSEKTGELNLIIGGTFGFPKDVYNKFQHTISLSKLTFPHEIARLMLLEQLFRSKNILAQKRYHY